MPPASLSLADTPSQLGAELWAACMGQLASELPEQQFNTWIKPLAATVELDLSKITLYVANRFKLDWVRAQYSAKISSVLEKIHGQKVGLELALTPRETPIRSFVAAGIATPDIPFETVHVAEDNAAEMSKNRLNSALNFDTLVEGSANRMARAAASHVANNMGGYKYLYVHQNLLPTWRLLVCKFLFL